MQKATDSGTARKSNPFQVSDPEAMTLNMMRLFEEGGRALSGLLERTISAKGPHSMTSDMSEASKALGEVSRAWMADPTKLMNAQTDLARNYAELWGRSFRRMFGEAVEPMFAPEPADARFKDPEWTENPYFDFLKQAYLLTTHWAEELVVRADGIDDRTRQRADFYLRQISSALSPSNFPFTNPEVVRETIARNGENLVQGMNHLVEDMQRSGDLLKISQSDTSAFEVGGNLAITPGKVVFQNDLLQLIQYEPSTPSVHDVPLLIVPPWINKYYILDLQPPKSFVKYAVDQGFTVFIVSWVNPDSRLAHKTFEDYMREGILESAAAVTKATGVEQINVLGYCVGGTLLACALSWLAARREDRFHSASFLAAQADFSEAGDLLVFIDDTQLKALEEMMSERGYLDGSRMANVFNMLRPKDLIWPYIVNNYLLGKKPFPFDLLFWNQDSTRMPASNHAYYLREFYHENRLAKGTMTLGGERLDLKKVKLPIYELATREDHIAPARSVYIGSRMYGGPVRFVCAGSGHIAGVVNPPGKNKYQYWTHDELPPYFDDWMSAAEEHAGSWWPDWAAWLSKNAGNQVKPRIPGDGGLKALEDAPGAYVRMKG